MSAATGVRAGASGLSVPQTTVRAFDFDLPARLEASRPPEERGSGRDDVRLMVARRSSPIVEHRRFTDLPGILAAGDLLLVNTSATLAAALAATVETEPAVLHLSARREADRWVVELRRPAGGGGTTPWLTAVAGTVVSLPAGARARLDRPASATRAGVRLWEAEVTMPEETLAYLAAHGRPIRYGYADRDRPIGAYQTVFADEPGSAEMPSAARPFTAELVTRLITRGIGIAPVLLHTGVSSPEAHEPPTAEWFRVPADTAARVNAAHRSGRRVVAVGTTAVRAIESAAVRGSLVLPAEGWTDLVVTPERGVRAIDGMVTGWHEPRASHLMMLEAVGGRPVLERSYRAALEEGYLWHEFGDSHLILP